MQPLIPPKTSTRTTSDLSPQKRAVKVVPHLTTNTYKKRVSKEGEDGKWHSFPKKRRVSGLGPPKQVVQNFTHKHTHTRTSARTHARTQRPTNKRNRKWSTRETPPQPAATEHLAGSEAARVTNPVLRGLERFLFFTVLCVLFPGLFSSRAEVGRKSSRWGRRYRFNGTAHRRHRSSERNKIKKHHLLKEIK